MHKSLQIAILIGALLAIALPGGAASSPKLTTLYNFQGLGGGSYPEANVVLGPSGVLYGTTYSGGPTGPSGWGTVFQLSQASGVWTKRALYGFTGGPDGANPQAGVVVATNGVLYGTTFQGGASGLGTVYSLSPPATQGGKWTQAVIYSFSATGGDGMNPQSGLVLNKTTGVLYGTTSVGGASGYGTVFSLTPPVTQGGPWTESILYSFAGASFGCGPTGPACDGAFPEATLALASNGTLYGTTYGGGVAGWGTVFSLTSLQGNWTETVLYSFNGAPSGAGGGVACGTTGQPACDGGAPAGGVVIGPGGVLYGTTSFGGNPNGCPLGGYADGCGAVFQLTPPAPPSATWTENLLYVFAGPPKDGSHPSQTLALGHSGALFGTTLAGASSENGCFPASYTGCGMVYTLKPPVPPATSWTKSNMVIFNNDNGGGPNGVILNSKGLLFGTTYVGGTGGGYGTVFQVTP